MNILNILLGIKHIETHRDISIKEIDNMFIPGHEIHINHVYLWGAIKYRSVKWDMITYKFWGKTAHRQFNTIDGAYSFVKEYEYRIQNGIKPAVNF